METDKISVSVLGPLSVRRGDEDIDIGGAKQQLVLLALVMADNGVVSTDRLIDLVWGENPPAKPNVTLRTYISHLRRGLDPDRAARDRSSLLVTRSPGYVLELGDAQVDARMLEAHTTAGRSAWDAGDLERAATEAGEAVSLWQPGDFSTLSDKFPIDAAHLLGLRREATTILHRSLLDLGRHDEALPSLRATAEADPADEEVCRQLMLALYRSGKAGESIDEASRFRSHLLDELGLDPSEQLQSLEGRILDNDPALWQTATPQDLPSAVAASAATDAPAGREEAFARAAAALDASLAGEAVPIVAVVGEPGIGKTTLLNALASFASQRGRPPVWGRCHDGGQTNTLWPWASILRDLFDRFPDDELTAALGHRAGEIAELVPELCDRLGVEPVSGKDALSLFDAIARTIRSLATPTGPDDTSRRPITLILEDAHWSDVASIKFFEVAEPIWAGAPIACLVSWRDTQETDPQLATAIGGLARLNNFERIELDGLDAASLCVMHRDLRGEDVTLEAIRPLLERTQGNPLFATELLRHGLDQPLSTTLRDAVSERVSQLPEIGSDLLVFGALCRDGFTTAVLEAASGKADDVVLEIVERALAARLIETHPDAFDRFQFTHSLVQETLATTTSAPRRARVHARLGDFYESRNASPELLAHHFLQGLNTGQLGADYALAAANNSSRLHDHATTADLLRRALATLDQIHARGDGPTEFERLRVQLLLAIGQNNKHRNNIEETHQIVPQAFEVAASNDLIDEMVLAALVYTGDTQQTAGWLGYWCPSGPAIEMFTQCLDRLAPDHPAQAGLTSALGGVLFGEHADPVRRRKLMAEGIEQARRLSAPAIKAKTLGHIIVQVDRDYSRADRARLAHEAIDAARGASAEKPEMNARRLLAMQALEVGDIDAFYAEADHITRLAQSSDNEALVFEANLLPATGALLTGDFATAERLIQATFDDFNRLGEAVLDLFGIPFALLLRERGMLDVLVEALRDKVAGYPGPAYATPLALGLAQRGDIAEARELMAPYSPELVSEGGERVLQFMTPWFYADLVRIFQDVEAARVCREHLDGNADRIVAMNGGQLIFGFASLPLGFLSTMLGDIESAERYLALSLDQHMSLGARPSLLRTHLALMELAHQQGQAERASTHHREAVALADEMDALHWEIELVEARIGSK